VTAIKDYTPSTSVDVGAFKKDFGPFLQALSYSPSNDFLQLAQNISDKYPDYFLSYLALAMAYQALNQTDAAQANLKSARDESNGDYASLLPSDLEFQNQIPEQALYYVAPDIWLVPHFFTVEANQTFSLFECGYLVRLDNGSLVFINPVPVTQQVSAAIQQTCGSVPDFLVVQTKHRYAFLPEIQQTFPNAKTYGVQAQKDYNQTANLNFTGFLSDSQPLFPDEFAQFTFQGHEYDESAFVHFKNNTVFFTDMLTDSVTNSADFAGTVPGTLTNQTSFFMRLYYWTYGVYNQLAVPDYQEDWGLITNASLFSQSIQDMEQDIVFDQIYLCQGGLVTQDARAKFVSSFSPYLTSV